MALSYRETLDYLYAQLPMFTRIGAAAFKKDLTNSLALSKLLGHPETQFKTIHIAGTNGKGSSSHMLASVFQEAGYKTGLYTSPHLLDFRERIRINGTMIPEQEVIQFVETYRADFDTIKPSFFEWTVALCFQYFAKEKVDIAIIETGLGGRLDSTNIIKPELSLITNIGFDHMDMLGNTLPQIAFEKAGIIKPKTPVVVSETEPETEEVFRKKSDEIEAPIYLAKSLTQLERTGNNEYSARLNSGLDLKNLKCDLEGNYQINNIRGVLTALDVLRESYKISETDIRFGLSRVQQNTGLQGRWQKLSENPLCICDTGHNEHGLKWVLEQLANQKYKTLRMVIGMVKDKDISKVLSMLPKDATYYFCAANLPRALEAKELQAQASGKGLLGETYPSVIEAVNAAKKEADPSDLIFIGGSTFVVAEALEGF